MPRLSDSARSRHMVWFSWNFWSASVSILPNLFLLVSARLSKLSLPRGIQKTCAYSCCGGRPFCVPWHVRHQRTTQPVNHYSNHDQVQRENSCLVVLGVPPCPSSEDEEINVVDAAKKGYALLESRRNIGIWCDHVLHLSRYAETSTYCSLPSRLRGVLWC